MLRYHNFDPGKFKRGARACHKRKLQHLLRVPVILQMCSSVCPLLTSLLVAVAAQTDRRVRRSIVHLHAVVRSTGVLLAVLAVGVRGAQLRPLGQQLYYRIILRTHSALVIESYELLSPVP